jgi:hypothetical protein
MNERTAKEVVEEMYRRQHSGDHHGARRPGRLFMARNGFEPLGPYRSWSNGQVGWFFMRTRYCCGRSLPPRPRH